MDQVLERWIFQKILSKTIEIVCIFYVVVVGFEGVKSQEKRYSVEHWVGNVGKQT